MASGSTPASGETLPRRPKGLAGLDGPMDPDSPARTGSPGRSDGPARTGSPGRSGGPARTGSPGRTGSPAGQDGWRAAGQDTTTSRSRQVLAWTLALAGLLAYNWWLLVPLKPGLMTSPNELFSNLEVSGQPYAAAMQHADLLSGVLLFGAFLAAGRRSIPTGHRDWLAMLAFALGGAAGGLFPEVCADGISALCREQEFHFQLPVGQYVHIAAGIAEFGAITIALILAIRRPARATPDSPGSTAASGSARSSAIRCSASPTW
jgi:hypothetical protein